MTSSARLDVVRRAARAALARTLERQLFALGIDEHGTMLIAVSGGADSSALLLLATAVAQRRGWRVEAATVDHHLRESSRGDALAACALAESIGVPCSVLDVQPGGGAGAPARARHERYRALAEHAHARGLRAVVTAHHARDQLETMLMAVMRGTGARAAGGMAARRRLAPGVTLVRPLLEVPAAKLPALCRALGVAWCEDPSNEDASALRVRLRQRVIPELERSRAGVEARAAALASLLQEAGRLLERRARRVAAACSREEEGVISIDRAALLRKGSAMRREVLRQLLSRIDANASARMLAEIDAAIMDGRHHERRWRTRSRASIRLLAERIELSAAGSVRGCAIPHN